MNDKLPYEAVLEQRFKDLPLPPEDQSWQAMSALLDKEDKPGFGAGFINYGGFVLCGLAIIGWSWILLRNSGMKQQEAQTSQVMISYKTEKNNRSDANAHLDDTRIVTGRNNKNIDTQQAKRVLPTGTNIPVTGGQTNVPAETANIQTRDDKVKDKSGDAIANKQADRNVSEIAKEGKEAKNKNLLTNGSINVGKQGLHKKDKTSDNHSATNATGYVAGHLTDKIPGQAGTSIAMGARHTNGAGKRKSVETIDDAAELSQNTLDINKQPVLTPPANDIIPEQAATAVTKNDTSIRKGDNKIAGVNAGAKNNKVNKRLLWSVGVGVQQQIPLGGQKIVAYGYDGSKSILNDYIPHIYLRAERPQKWFAQAEFSYGSPQSVPALAYNRKTRLNESFTQMTTTTLSLRKTYYHDIPLSFNYFIIPGWSVGAGAMYSLLHRSIAEKQTTIKDLQTQQEMSSVVVIPSAFTDSFLYKSKWHWLVQTSYDWRRFSFGLRYIKDAESYIKYTLPNGEMEDRKNWSLQCFVRFRLWQSR